MSEELVESPYVTKHQALQIAQEGGRAAATELLTALGVDTSSPEAIIKQQVDFAHLRRHRRSTEAIRQHSFKVAVGVAITGVLGALWMAMKKNGV